jgi:UDP-glucose:(heptosyl)LPS alpha-1,3-glucosyltransferase
MTDAPVKRLRIAVLNRVFAATGGGAERYSIAVVEQLAARHEIHVFAQQTTHAWPGVTYHRVSMPLAKPRWLNQLWYATATWWKTRRGFDIVHSHENTWHGNVQTLHVKTVRRSVLGGRSGLQWLAARLKVAFSPRLGAYLLLERARLRLRPDRAVVVVSQTLLQEVQQEYPATRSMLHVITPGVDTPARIATKKEARHALSTGAEGQIVLFVANDYRRKGLDALLQAMTGLPTAVRLLVAGSCAQMGTYRDLARAMGLGDRVEFLGPQQDMQMAYACADVLAHPTLEDSFGMVVLEAMAYGLPVLVSGARHCGFAASLQDEKDALLLVDPNNAEEVRTALHRILSDKALADALIANAADVVRMHTWQHAAMAYDGLYRRLVSAEMGRP